MWPFGRDKGRVLPEGEVRAPMPPVSPPATAPRDIVARLLDPMPRTISAHVYQDGNMRDPMCVEAALEIERLRKGLTEPQKMVFMGDGGRGAYHLVAMLVDALGHLSGMQQAGAAMDAQAREDTEIILVNAACEIYTGLTGVKISTIDTFKKMDALNAVS